MRIVIDKDIITNGDMVKTMFKITTLKEDDDFITCEVDGLGLARFVIEKKWWDAVYKGEISGGEE